MIYNIGVDENSNWCKILERVSVLQRTFLISTIDGEIRDFCFNARLASSERQEKRATFHSSLYYLIYFRSVRSHGTVSFSFPSQFRWKRAPNGLRTNYYLP